MQTLVVYRTQLLLPSTQYDSPSRSALELHLCYAFIFVTIFMQQNLTRYLQAYTVPWARRLSPKEQKEVDHYRHHRERDQEGPHYSVLDSSSSSARKGTAARVNFDPFTGMPSYAGRYQKKRRTLPHIDPTGGPYEFSMLHIALPYREQAANFSF